MADAYAQLIDDLRQEIDQRGARPSAIDAGVAELDALGGGAPEDLLPLLSDAAEADEGMFSLIHAAEATDDRRYVAGLLRVFPALLASAPRWASIVLMRVLNGEAARVEIVRQLADATPEERAAVRDACTRINAVSPQFLAKTVAVTVATA